MVKLAVLLRRKKGFTFEEFERHWEGPHAELVCGIPEFTRHLQRYSQSHVIDPSYNGEGMTWKRSSFDGIAEVWFDTIEKMTLAFNEPKFVDLVGPDDERFITPEEVSILVTEEIEKIARNGNPRVKLSVIIKRRPDLTFEEFDRHWVGPHADLVQSVPEFTRHVRRYVQAHVISDYTGDGDSSKLQSQWGTAAFDGIAELWFDSVGDMVAAFNEPKFIEQIAPDDEKFIDQSATQLMVLREADMIP